MRNNIPLAPPEWPSDKDAPPAWKDRKCLPPPNMTRPSLPPKSNPIPSTTTNLLPVTHIPTAPVPSSQKQKTITYQTATEKEENTYINDVYQKIDPDRYRKEQDLFSKSTAQTTTENHTERKDSYAGYLILIAMMLVVWLVVVPSSLANDSSAIPSSTSVYTSPPTPSPVPTVTSIPTAAPERDYPHNSNSTWSSGSENHYSGKTVYIPQHGSKYHYNPNCSGMSGTATTLESAKRAGYTPCKKCAG